MRTAFFSPKAYTAAAMLFTLALSSCGRKFDRIDDGGFTEVTFTSPRSDHLHAMSTLTGGIMITAYSSTYVTNMYLADETASATISLPNGSYSFHAFGYGYSLHTSGTDLRCATAGAGGSPVVLNGTASTVSLDFRQSKCGDAGFTAGANYQDANTNSTLTNSGPIFPEVHPVFCGTAATNFGTVVGTNDCSSSSPMGGITAMPSNTVSRYQVIIPIFKYQGGVFTRMAEAVRTPCSAGSISGLSGGAVTNGRVRYPSGAASLPYAFPIEVEAFTESACTSTPLVSRKFHKGMAFGPDPEASSLGSAVPKTTTYPNQLRLFVREP